VNGSIASADEINKAEGVNNRSTNVTCPPKVVPIVKLVFVENEGDTEYDTQTVHT
jgi:hypothetical protein